MQWASGLTQATRLQRRAENWGVVPIPQYDDNQQKITTSDMTAFMWVKGSTRSEAVKCWFECVRASKTDPKYEQTNKDKFMENNLIGQTRCMM